MLSYLHCLFVLKVVLSSLPFRSPRAQWHHPVGGDDCITIGTARWMAFLGLNISNIGLKTVTALDTFPQIPKANVAGMADIAHEKQSLEAPGGSFTAGSGHAGGLEWVHP